ncbi:hypothetical protein D3C87_2137270 [compost metagenome]
MLDDFPDASDPGSDDRKGGRHRLYIDKAERLMPLRGADEAVGGLIEPVNVAVGNAAGKNHGEAQPLR